MCQGKKGDGVGGREWKKWRASKRLNFKLVYNLTFSGGGSECWSHDTLRPARDCSTYDEEVHLWRAVQRPNGLIDLSVSEALEYCFAYFWFRGKIDPKDNKHFDLTCEKMQCFQSLIFCFVWLIERNAFSAARSVLSLLNCVHYGKKWRLSSPSSLYCGKPFSQGENPQWVVRKMSTFKIPYEWKQKQQQNKTNKKRKEEKRKEHVDCFQVSGGHLISWREN